MESINANKQEPELNLDLNVRRNFVKFFKALPEKSATTVRFFDRSDYYTVHGQTDCDLIARTIYKSTTRIHLMIPGTSDSLPYLTLSKVNFENAVREMLLVRNYRVEVYVKRTTGDWHLEYRGSPGNLLQFEDILFTNREVLISNCVLSVYCRTENGGGGGECQRKLGIVAIEQNDCVFQVLELVDDDFYTELEATVVLLGPKECLLPSDDGEYETIAKVLQRNGAMVTICRKSKAFNKSEIIQDLNRLIRFEKGQQEDANGLPEIQLTLAMDALYVAIKYLDLLNDASNLGQYVMKQLELKRFVHLDSAAISALNVLPKPGVQMSSPAYKWHSIVGVLDRCRTPQGHRLMAQWIKQPLRSLEILSDRHNIVQCLLESPDSLKILHDDYLKRIPDVLMLTKKLLRNKANLQDIFRIYQVLLRTPKIINILLELENATVQSVLVDPLKSYLQDLFGLKEMVEQIMDFEAVENGEYLVKASFDDNLKQMKERLDVLLKKMERLRDKANKDLELEKNQAVRLENVSQCGYHFRITLKDDTSLRRNKSYEVLCVVKGGVRFTSDKLKDISAEFCELRLQYEEQQRSIVTEIIKVVIGYAAPLNSLNNDFAQLDCLVSFAIAAQSAPRPYVRPKMLPEGSGELTLKELRHPCLELQEHVSFIANDVTFKTDICNMLIITGPNMGGKSTYIRSVGTAVLMAHVGSFVPCNEANISMVDAILGRVGASDNIIKGLSTFMVEMIETSGIIRTATDNSLVIIDELGRGTSTYEGCGIAWSIAEYLAKQTQCFSLFATHFHEITQLSDYSDTVKNCHMAAIADNEHFTLLYQVKSDAMTKSFGIQIAKLANFPQTVVQKAQEIYNEFEDEYASVQTLQDQELIAKVNEALEKFYIVGNDAEINENDLKELVEKFSQDIKQLDSEYFKVIAKTDENK